MYTVEKANDDELEDLIDFSLYNSVFIPSCGDISLAFCSAIFSLTPIKIKKEKSRERSASKQEREKKNGCMNEEIERVVGL